MTARHYWFSKKQAENNKKQYAPVARALAIDEDDVGHVLAIDLEQGSSFSFTASSYDEKDEPEPLSNGDRVDKAGTHDMERVIIVQDARGVPVNYSSESLKPKDFASLWAVCRRDKITMPTFGKNPSFQFG